MSEELKVLKQRRGTIKSKLTKFQSYVDNFDLSTNSVIELRIRRDNVQPILKTFESIQDDIELQEKSSKQSEERDSFEDQYFACLAKVEVILSSAGTPSTSTAVTPTIIQQPYNELQIKLPNIVLPTFTGQYDQWMSFFETFQSLIHENINLNNIQKFHYLKSCLKGEAACIVDSLGISSSNYETAWELIKERYENKRILIKTQVDALFDLPVAIKDNPASLRSLLDTATKNIKILKNLNLPTDSWDVLIIRLMSAKFDFVTKREWEQQSIKSDVPTFKEFSEFISNRCKMMEAMNFPSKNGPHQKLHKPVSSSFSHVSTNKPQCAICKQTHFINQCNAFQTMPVERRLIKINSLKLCNNCLKANHTTNACRSSNSCKHCQKRHHSLLHNTTENSSNLTTEVQTITQPASSAISNHCYNQASTQVLLSTALIHVFDSSGEVQECRAIIDGGSQSNFITSDMCRKLKLNLKNANVPICGINQSASQAKQLANIKFKSRYNAFTAKIECLVLAQITGNLPLLSIPYCNFTIPSNIRLADPHFNISSSVDLLLGAGMFWQLLCVGQIKLSRSQPYLQKTHLGWLVGGDIQLGQSHKAIAQTPSISNLAIESSLETQINKFWEIEELGPDNKIINLSKEEIACEQHFVSTYKRDQSGRFIVQLPLKENIKQLGASDNLALKRFLSLERKLNKDAQLKRQYSDFIHEYISLGHMELIPEKSNNQSREKFYLPHHAVLKESSTTTKLRVVFDGSAKTDSGISLNDTLMTGPVIQQDLFSILARFRIHQFVLTADIVKMYRQILIAPCHRDFHRIFWRNRLEDPITTYRLNTVTYGTAASSFLAIRCLHELARVEASNFPLAQAAIIRDFYVDDLLTGANDMSEVIKLRDQLIQVLKKGGFELQKWASNHKNVIPESISNIDTSISLDKQDETKLLGLIWNCSSDELKYTVKVPAIKTKVTKRIILSSIAQLFDPLGLICPILISAKILLQSLWSLKIDWDESVPMNIHSTWTQFIGQLDTINRLKIPRKVIPTAGNANLEIHGFCDSSERAYGACIYIRITNQVDNKYYVNLLCAKSKVAPLKSTTLPRLELCGAVLLARLIDKIANIFEVPVAKCYCWTDSTIVLSWASSPPSKWQTFVANRVAELQSLTNINNWNHVSSRSNPADLLSRGVTPNNLINSKLWWHGPQFLLENYETKNNCSDIALSDIPEQRKQVLTTIVKVDNEILSKFSSYTKLQRVIAWCFRFINNSKPNSPRVQNHLKTAELKNADLFILRSIQSDEFGEEINNLKKDAVLPKTSKLLSLNPFLCENGLIRVGGRLKNAQIAYDAKHQILLPPKHKITKLIIQHEHERQLHAGPQATLAALHQKYWPISGRNITRQVIHKCVKCFRVRPKGITQLMGDLPSTRIEQPLRPFLNCGVDFAGPLSLKESTGRGKRFVKGYIALFVCFNTRAVHLELVGNLTTESFLNALKRFISRRGNVLHMYSDNATNFVGATRELAKLHKQFIEQCKKPTVLNELANHNITWHFIPPRSPHFGGLWEAGIKSVKGHLKRIVGNASLTYEELYTLLTRIEACLNSRPITPVSSNPNDINSLTPGHFLIGDSLTAPVEPDVTHIQVNRLSRWQHVEQLRQHFWRRWSREYLSTLQQRPKWKSRNPQNLEINAIVLIKDDNLPPLKWLLGRITEIHPGSDGLARVVSLRTQAGVVKRAITKICPLPIDNN